MVDATTEMINTVRGNVLNGTKTITITERIGIVSHDSITINGMITSKGKARGRVHGTISAIMRKETYRFSGELSRHKRSTTITSSD